jgi:hypothetical protein
MVDEKKFHFLKLPLPTSDFGLPIFFAHSPATTFPGDPTHPYMPFDRGH